MKIANIDRENFHIFCTNWETSMKFPGKMCLMIILKVWENHGLTLSSEETLLEKSQGGMKLNPWLF